MSRGKTISNSPESATTVQRAGTWVGLVLLLSAMVPIAGAQVNPCVSSSWSDTTDVHTEVRPEVDEYRGRITFRTQPGCSAAAGCNGAGANEARFEVVSPPDWVKANFTKNPAPVNGSTDPLGTRETSNEMFFRLNRSAPFESSFSLQVRASCGFQSLGSVSKGFRVGPLVNVSASVVDSSKITDGAQWLVQLTNTGNVAVMVSVHPHPSQEEADVHWAIPEVQTVGTAQSGVDSVVVVPIRATGDALPANLSLTVRVVEEDDAAAPPFDIELALPYTVFSGQSTPAPGLALLLSALALVLRRRHASA
jgi:hypothetical protein